MKKIAVQLAVLLVMGSIFLGARLATLSKSDRQALASEFHFKQMTLPNAPFAFEPAAFKKEVNPNLALIAPWVALVGTGVSLVDFDQDGISNDLCQTDPRSKSVSLYPVPGTGDRYPRRELLRPGVDFPSEAITPSTCESGDFNRDGRIDFVISFLSRLPMLLIQRTDSERSFEKIEIANPALSEWYTTATVVADFDGDGYLDIFFGNYWREGQGMYDPKSKFYPQLQNSLSSADNGGPDFILLRKPKSEGIVFETTQPFTEAESRSYCLAVAAGDLNGDALPELYVSNDFGPDNLFVNKSEPGKLIFQKVRGKRNFFTPKSKALGWDSFKGMGADMADLNGDGILDIYVSNIAGEWKVQESHFLWMSTGDTTAFAKGFAPYREASEELGLSRNDWGWDAKLIDLNNDGNLEAIQATGAFKGKTNKWPELQQWAMGLDNFIADPKYWPNLLGDDISGNSPNRFYVRAKDGYFHDLGPETGLGGAYCSRGFSVGDIDEDGDQDLFVANMWEDSYLYLNEPKQPKKFVGLKVLQCHDSSLTMSVLEKGNTAGGQPCSPAIGATVRLVIDGKPGSISLVDGGNGHGGNRSKEVFFGADQIPDGTPLNVVVTWRSTSGMKEQANFPVNFGWSTLKLCDGMKNANASL